MQSVDHLVYHSDQGDKSTNKVLVDRHINLQFCTSSLVILSNGAFTLILSIFKRILAIARMWAVFSLFLSSFILNSFASGFKSFIRWTSLIVALSSQAKIMLSADNKVSPEM